MSITEFAGKMNAWGGRGNPFLFMVDFEMQRPMIFPLTDIDRGKLLYHVNGKTNADPGPSGIQSADLTRFPIPFEEYKKKFQKVKAHLSFGDSYLTNLTVKTRVTTPRSLREIFHISHARYKLWYEDQFLVFSPETFVRISGGRIFSHPMKGTIDASIPHAREKILEDQKEKAEHITIVDLIRNDLSTVATNVVVTRFRYIEKIRTMHKDLLQVSSEIQGDLPHNGRDNLGDIFLQLLPAGSVSGAPKRKTMEIIREAENEPRGYYTGVMGLFDGDVLDSGVMIRFMERNAETLYYRSGGGITTQSTVETEYQETIDKVYVPLG